MTTSPITTLSKPSSTEGLAPIALGYLRARTKRKAYDLIIKEFKRSGLTQADIARRLGKPNRTDRISKLLSGPGNWTLDTVADLLYAISGAIVKLEADYPFNKIQLGRPVQPDAKFGESDLYAVIGSTPQSNVQPTIILGMSDWQAASKAQEDKQTMLGLL